MSESSLHPVAGRPMPQNLSDWPRFLDRDRTRPAPVEGERALTDEGAARYQAYNLAVGPVPTDDVAKVNRAIADAHTENQHSSLAGQRCVIIDGPPMVGKTHAALSVALRETRAVWQAHEQAGGGPGRPIPWIYVEITAAPRGHGILAGMHRFCGIPSEARDTTLDLLVRLRDLAPKMGTRGVIIDDSHGLAGGRTRESTALADTLKGVITGLPITVVIVAADLARFGALGGPAGEQVRYRAIWTQLGNWPVPARNNGPGPWERLAATMTKHLAFPYGVKQCRLDRLGTLQALAEGSLKRPGIAIDWIKLAANYAIANDAMLDRSALEATHRNWLATKR